MAEGYFFPQVTVKPRTILLKEGEKAKNIYFVKQGCLRLWMNNNGKEITNQFFFEGSLVASLESMISNQPSDFHPSSILNTKPENKNPQLLCGYHFPGGTSNPGISPKPFIKKSSSCRLV